MKYILFFILTTFTMQIFAKNNINCQINHRNYNVSIIDNSVFIKNRNRNKNRNKNRKISSVYRVNPKSTFLGNSIEANFIFKKNQYLLHIENKQSLNALNDYIEINDRKGHSVILILKCK